MLLSGSIQIHFESRSRRPASRRAATRRSISGQREPGAVQAAPVAVGDEEGERPALVQVQVEGAVHVRPVVVVIRRGDIRHCRHQGRRRVHGRLQRRCAGVRRAEDADAAVGPGLLRRPLDRVVPVTPLLLEGVERAAGAVSAARILVEAHVAAPGEVHQLGVVAVAAVRLAAAGVRAARQHHRIIPGMPRQVHLGGQPYAVAHRHLLDNAGDFVRIGLGKGRRRGGRQDERKRKRGGASSRIEQHGEDPGPNDSTEGRRPCDNISGQPQWTGIPAKAGENGAGLTVEEAQCRSASDSAF